MGSYLGTSLGDAGSWGLLVYLPLYRNRISDWEGSLAKVTLKFSGSPRKRTQAPHSQPPKGLAERPPPPVPSCWLWGNTRPGRVGHLPLVPIFL